MAVSYGCLGRLDETNNRRTQLGHRRRFGFPSRAMLAPQRPHAGALSLRKKRSAPHLWHFITSMQAPGRLTRSGEERSWSRTETRLRTRRDFDSADPFAR